MKNRFFLLGAILSMAIIVCAQKRVVWLHGLQGDQSPSTWDVYNMYFTPSNGQVVKYKSIFNSIKSAAASLSNDQINPQNQDVILVGHSMGGLVSRTMLQDNSKIIGVISAGTSHYGSNLIANAINGKVFNVFEIGVIKVNSALDKTLVASVFCAPPVSILAAPIAGGVYVFKCYALVGLVAIRVILGEAISVYSMITPCTQDLLPNSNYINELKNQRINIPYINIYAAEDYWQIVRIVGSLGNMDKVKKIENLDTSYDESYFSTINSALSTINYIKTAHNDVYKALFWPAIFMPWIWATRELLITARNEWDGVHRYIETDLHNNWSSMVGANTYELRTYCTEEWVNDVESLQSLEAPSKKIVSPDQLSSGHWERRCYTSYIPIALEHDGILNSKEAFLPQNLVGTYGQIWNIRVSHVNHQEMGNHIEMKKIFNDAFINNSYGKVFSLQNQ